MELKDLFEVISELNADLERNNITDEEIKFVLHSDGNSFGIDFMGMRLWDTENFVVPKISMKAHLWNEVERRTHYLRKALG